MARRLSFQQIVLGLALTTNAAGLSSAIAQTAPSTNKAPTTQRDSDLPQEKTQDKTQEKQSAAQGDDKPGDDKHDGDKKRDGDRRGDGRGNGRRDGGRGPNPDYILQLMQIDPGYLLEAVKRDGGPLELLSPLMKPEVRQQMGLEPQHAMAVDKFFAEMSKRFEDDIKANKDQPDADWYDLFRKMLESENAKFDEFLKKDLPPESRDRLIGIFVQLRHLRALSNRVVAVEKLGMTPERAKEVREDIHRIRMDTIRENDDWARRRIESGNSVQQQEQVEKVRAKIDARIEKLVTKPELEKLKALRGNELPPALLHSLDRPPGPPPKKD